MDKQRVLVIDDELSQLKVLTILLTRKGYTVKCATSGKEALSLCEVFRPDAVILDIHLPDIDGLTVLQELKKASPSINTIMITAYHDMETTVKAMRLGAYEYITKPIDVNELQEALDRALRHSRDKGRMVFLDQQPGQDGPIIGNCKAMKDIFKTIGVLSGKRVTVLIEGETGTGKELIAKALHYYSPNRDSPFLAVNCSVFVGNLIESELFGHEKGAFTGAVATKKGLFELAGSGSIFLDEIGELPVELQAKLLRFLQEREFQRVGGEKTLRSDARVIAATNRNLIEMVNNGTFREDLYYRLSVSKIYVPPLRQRKEDIPLIVQYLLKKINRELNSNVRQVEEKAMLRLIDYHWPGNVRQLENILTRALVNSHDEALLDEILEPLLQNDASSETKVKPGTVSKSETSPKPATTSRNTASLHELEQHHILDILSDTNWNISRASKILGISRPTLRLKIKQYQIVKP